MFSPILGCARHFLMLPLEPSIWWNVTAEGVRNALCENKNFLGFPFFSQWRFQLAGLQIGREESGGAAINSWYDPVAPGLNSHPKASCSENLGAESNRPDLMLFTSLQLQPSSTTTAADGTIGQGRIDYPAGAACPNGPGPTTQSRLIQPSPPHRGKSVRAAEARARAERAGRQTTIRGLAGKEVAVAAAGEGTGIAGTIST